MDQPRPLPHRHQARLRHSPFALLLGGAVLGGLALPPAAGATSWQAIDQLRQVLQRAGVPVVQRDCGSRGLQGLYHPRSDTIVVCRVHRDPAAVWNTLAHEATHRMQACRGGAITDPRHHRAMAAALARRSPQDLASLKMYPPQERIGELEARYTAQLPPAQVIQLFERYCGGGGRSYARLSHALP